MPTPGPGLPTAPPPSDAGPGWPGAPCFLDADCGAGNFCELRICIAGCPAAACEADDICDPHGRCIPPDSQGDPKHALAGTPALSDRVSALAFGETQARTILRNDGTGPLSYRLAAANPALTLDTALAQLAPGAETSLVVDIDLAALAPADRVLPVQIITSGGALLWAVQLDGPSTRVDGPHYKATRAQREAGGGTYAAERRIGYKALRKAGLSPEQSRHAIEFADRYFGGLGATPSTPTNIPKDRR